MNTINWLFLIYIDQKANKSEHTATYILIGEIFGKIWLDKIIRSYFKNELLDIFWNESNVLDDESLRKYIYLCSRIFFDYSQKKWIDHNYLSYRKIDNSVSNYASELFFREVLWYKKLKLPSEFWWTLRSTISTFFDTYLFNLLFQPTAQSLQEKHAKKK